MTRYAEGTQVSADRSRAEIERLLVRYDATAFAYLSQTLTQGAVAVILFEMRGRRIRFTLPLPTIEQQRYTPAGRVRTTAQQKTALEQATRQRWRALALIVKAKLEAVESGVSTFEAEFLAQTVLPTGATVSEWLEPQLDEAYRTQRLPRLLTAPRENSRTTAESPEGEATR